MKKSLMILACVVASLTAYAQGTVNFSNLGVGLNAPIFDTDGTTRLAGNNYTAELLVGATASSLQPVNVTANFLSGGAAGYFQGGVKALQGFAGGSRPFFQVRVWDNRTGSSFDTALNRNASGVLQFSGPLGDPGASPPTTPATLAGLQSFSLVVVPEPSTIALAILGAGALLLRRRK